MRGVLKWWPDLGRGFYPVEDRGVYDAGYFERYRDLDQGPMADALNRARRELVLRHLDPGLLLVDVGVGGGRFRREMEEEMGGPVYGFDVCPPAVRMLQDLDRYRSPYREGVEAVTLWDSLEHLRYPGDLLDRVSQWAFISIPIFRDEHHILESRHYRPDEHFWYFTESGLVRWMAEGGWDLVESNDVETQLGREDIRSFAFRRRRVGDA